MKFSPRSTSALALALICLLEASGMGSAAAVASEQATQAKPPLSPGIYASPTFNKTSLPQLPHENAHTSWPQPDYFSEALKLTKFAAEDRYKSLHIRNEKIPDSAQYIVLPVQTQAFAFSPAFRAIVGAKLDELLASMGISASRQTDVLDAYGPFVRRLDDAAVTSFAVEHPKQRLVAFYLGHDGSSHAFLDLTVGDGEGKNSAHKVIDLPEDPLQAITAISQAIPALLLEAGFKHVDSKADISDARFSCTDAAWELGTWQQSARGTQQACRALVVGTLLPNYDADAIRLGRMLSPAKLAWLAQAYVIAEQSASKSDTAKAVRDLSLTQLEIGSGDTPLVAYVVSEDPVVSRVAKLLTIWDRAAQNPARSERELVDKFLIDATQGLPDFVRSIAIERINFFETFRQVDFCGIEREFPGPLMRSQCDARQALPRANDTRPASPAERLLYQEWRIAKSYKDLVHYGLTLGRYDKLQHIERSMPSDVASYPFIQRLRYRISTDAKAIDGETFDELLARHRIEVQQFVQSTINLQGNDRWLAGYSVSQHTWTRNSYILDDEQIRQSTAAERRLLSVLSYDRFVPDRFIQASKRAPGEPAFFLASASPVEAPVPKPFTPTPVVSASPTLGAPAINRGGIVQPYRPMLFMPHHDFLETPSIEEFQERLKRYPQDMDSRTRLGIALLKDGTPLAEVVKLFNAHPVNQRDGKSVGESHIWATPAHVFYLSGEIQAARPFYEKVRTIGSGSDSDMLAEVRINLIDGKIDDALSSTEARVDRYGSDFARRDLMGLLFMTKQTASAWDTFKSRAVTAEDLDFWFGASVGHRQAGLDLPGIKTWLDQSNLNRVQIDFIDITYLYLHLMAILDRVPSEADIRLLNDLRGNHGSTDKRWAISATLIQSALAESDPKQTYARIAEEITSGIYPGGNDFMLPFYVWTAAQANKKDAYLADVRKATIQWDFNHTLAKAMLLAVEGQTAESLKFFKASQYELANLTWGRDPGLAGYRLPLQYEYALAGYLMYRKTGETAYRKNVLHALDGFEKTFPYFGWAYNLQAVLETDKKKQALAICRGRFLDPKSYFLTQVKIIKPVSCPAVLW